MHTHKHTDVETHTHTDKNNSNSSKAPETQVRAVSSVKFDQQALGMPPTKALGGKSYSEQLSEDGITKRGHWVFA